MTTLDLHFKESGLGGPQSAELSSTRKLSIGWPRHAQKKPSINNKNYKSIKSSKISTSNFGKWKK